MQKNKLFNKYVLPVRVAGFSFMGVSILSTVLLVNIIKLGNEIERDYQKEVVLNPNAKKQVLDAVNPLLCIVLILIGGFLAFSSYKIIYDDKQKAYKIGEKFLKDLLKQSPKTAVKGNTIDMTHLPTEREQIINAMREFDEIFQTPRALNAVINTICNSLIDEEQKEIIKIAREFDDMTLNKDKKVVVKTRNKILDIVKQHESIDPDFTRKILTAMADAHKTYILSANQMTR